MVRRGLRGTGNGERGTGNGERGTSPYLSKGAKSRSKSRLARARSRASASVIRVSRNADNCQSFQSRTARISVTQQSRGVRNVSRAAGVRNPP
ncbi:MAG: hypothetical protein FJ295_04055 [Planctomycetes bacterium]|nr:hypothetical protein [Planctomycetota bacterium]